MHTTENNHANINATYSRARVIPHQITHMQSLHTCLSCHSQHPVPTPLHSPSLSLCTYVYRHTHTHHHIVAYSLFAYRTTHSSHAYDMLHCPVRLLLPPTHFFHTQASFLLIHGDDAEGFHCIAHSVWKRSWWCCGVAAQEQGKH